MLPEMLAVGVGVLTGVAEWLQARRARGLASLAFGPSGRPAWWVRFTPVLRVLALMALTWGFATLYWLPAKSHQAKAIIEPHRIRHVVLVLDVSPSMKLKDAGPDLTQTRAERAAGLLQSFFERVPMEQVRLSVVATYTSAKPVVVDTQDVNVVKNILMDLPLSNAFEAGATNLFAGLTEAARLAHAWPRHSTTVIVLSDGDTVPPTGMPEMPPSVSHTVLIGIGDPRSGQFINGHQSRQDAATLKQVAIRLGGVYYDGNQKHLPSDLLRDITTSEEESALQKLTRREYALGAIGVGALCFALLPVALRCFGTPFQPGVRRSSARPTAARPTRTPAVSAPSVTT